MTEINSETKQTIDDEVHKPTELYPTVTQIEEVPV
jgi:hypothetical protein